MSAGAKEGSVFTFTSLPRGGTLVEGDDLRFQIGSYPETIKDTIRSERGVPDLFLLPDDLFDTDFGVSNTELEFPVYFNFYIKGRTCRFICHKHQVRLIVRVLREAIFGPFRLFLEREFPGGRDNPGFPDLHKEMVHYKLDSRVAGGRLRLKHMIRIHTFDENGQVEVDGVTLTSLGRNRYRLAGSGAPQECEFIPFREAATAVSRHSEESFYVPPVFGVTVIGSGHGFDAESQTAGFILWIDGKGILVDPPVNSTLWMQQNRVNTRLIEDLILTHCHADHDSGTVQKILEEGRIRVHTTETVMESFVAKYSALTSLRPADFRTLFEFQPIMIGTRTTIAGGKFLFKYNLHPIPTLGFDVEFEGQSFYYSCDTLYDPELIRSWHQQGILPEGRMQDLLKVPWHSSLILHEAGIPPIHTPMSVLAALPEDVKQRMHLVHVSESAIPPDSGLKIAIPGTASTMDIPVPTPQKSLAVKVLDVVCHIDLFADLKFKKALECLAITHHCVCEPGEVFIKRDTYGDKFFMILSGEVEVVHESLPQRLFFSRYDYIGETALILNQPRNADIVARRRTELLYIERDDFLRFVRDTPLPAIFTRLNQNRAFGARWTFEKHRILAALSPLQKNQLMCSMLSATIPSGTHLHRRGDEVACYHLIQSGEVRLSRDDGEAVLGAGSLIGEFGPCFEVDVHNSEAVALSDLSVFRVPARDMRAFFSTYPGTFVRLTKSLSDTILRQGSGGC
jgi:CRP-like cAMP-binding protein